MAQSDGLVRLTILSDDGHPKGARGHELARSRAYRELVITNEAMDTIG